MIPYLTKAEYDDMPFTGVADEKKFKEFLQTASDRMDIETNYFYQFNDFESDMNFRKTQFKKAVACQIGYMIDLGATTTEGMNKTPQSFSIGRTTINNPSRYNPSGENESKSLISDDALDYLRSTGLMYKGVRSK